MEIFNIPNILTIFRILLVPVFLYLITRDMYQVALVVFIVAGITDAVDGFIARRFNQRTELGANIDPLADKILLVSSYLILTVKGLVPLWLGVLVLLKDMVLVSGVFLLRGSGRQVIIRPSVFGKFTTFFQIITVVYSIAFPLSGNGFFNALVTITAILTVYTGFDYVRKEIRTQRAS